MSFIDLDDAETKRITYRGSERFSDKCADCGHTRADHLAAGISQPVGGGKCRTIVCKKEIVKKLPDVPHVPGIHTRHGKRYACDMVPCADDWKVK